MLPSLCQQARKLETIPILFYEFDSFDVSTKDKLYFERYSVSQSKCMSLILTFSLEIFGIYVRELPASNKSPYRLRIRDWRQSDLFREVRLQQ